MTHEMGQQTLQAFVHLGSLLRLDVFHGDCHLAVVITEMQNDRIILRGILLFRNHRRQIVQVPGECLTKMFSNCFDCTL